MANYKEAPNCECHVKTKWHIFLSMTKDNKINVTADTAGEVNFTCTVTDDNGRNAIANGTNDSSDR